MDMPDRTMDRYQNDGRNIVQNGQNYVQQLPGQGVVDYSPGQHQPYPNRMNGLNDQPDPAEEELRRNPRITQNAEAIIRYNKKGKNLVREGKHAAALDQVHENDLHNMPEVPQPKDKKKDKNGLVAVGAGGAAGAYAVDNYMKREMNLQGHYVDRAHNKPLHYRPTVRPKDGTDSDSELTTSFDPMKDRHMWTMWRTAVNGRIVDEVRRLERIKKEQGDDASTNLEANVPGVYGRAIVAPPLKQFIKFDDESRHIAKQLTSLGQGRLQAAQFIYYGLPRVYVPPSNNTPNNDFVSLPSDIPISVPNDLPTNGTKKLDII